MGGPSYALQDEKKNTLQLWLTKYSFLATRRTGISTFSKYIFSNSCSRVYPPNPPPMRSHYFVQIQETFLHINVAKNNFHFSPEKLIIAQRELRTGNREKSIVDTFGFDSFQGSAVISSAIVFSALWIWTFVL